MKYTPEIIIAFLEHWDEVTCFIERCTPEMFPTYYEYGEASTYWNQEGNTLLNKGPHNTRVPKKDSLKENLIVMKADISATLKKLNLEEQIAVAYQFQIDTINKKSKRSLTLARLATVKMAEILNGTPLDN